MRMKGKKVYFSYQDTFSLDSVLSPVILSALKRFKEVVTDPENVDYAGIPGRVIQDMFPDAGYDTTEEQSAQAHARWLEILDQMIYAFDLKNEPSIRNYNFKFNRLFSDSEENSMYRKLDLSVDNQEEYDRYCKDTEEYHKKVQEGHELLGRYLASLWW